MDTNLTPKQTAYEIMAQYSNILHEIASSVDLSDSKVMIFLTTFLPITMQKGLRENQIDFFLVSERPIQIFNI